MKKSIYLINLFLVLLILLISTGSFAQSASWVFAGPGKYNTVYSIHISKENPQIIYLLCNYYVYKTSDFGENWTRLGTISGCGAIASIAVDPQSPTTLFALEESG
jgi:hypothetical protein